MGDEPKNDRAALVREVAEMLWEWEASGELYGELAERVVTLVESRIDADLQRALQGLLPMPPEGYELKPRPAGSEPWWPLAVPAGAALFQDELLCLQAVAQRLRLDGRLV